MGDERIGKGSGCTERYEMQTDEGRLVMYKTIVQGKNISTDEAPIAKSDQQ